MITFNQNYIENYIIIDLLDFTELHTAYIRNLYCKQLLLY